MDSATLSSQPYQTCKDFIIPMKSNAVCVSVTSLLYVIILSNHYTSLVIFDFMSLHALFHRSISSFIDIFSHLSILPFNSLKPQNKFRAQTFNISSFCVPLTIHQY
jgi:hypothetical protein